LRDGFSIFCIVRGCTPDDEFVVFQFSLKVVVNVCNNRARSTRAYCPWQYVIFFFA
jgi:hypothetical protein